MSKQSTPRLKENEAQAYAKLVRTSPQKLNLVAQLIRGKSAAQAVNELTFSKRRVAGEVKKVVLSAVANAENNHGLDVDRLYIAEAYVGKTMTIKRFRARARGRVGSIHKFFSRVTVVVRERPEPVEKAEAA